MCSLHSRILFSPTILLTDTYLTPMFITDPGSWGWLSVRSVSLNERSLVSSLRKYMLQNLCSVFPQRHATFSNLVVTTFYYLCYLLYLQGYYASSIGAYSQRGFTHIFTQRTYMCKLRLAGYVWGYVWGHEAGWLCRLDGTLRYAGSSRRSSSYQDISVFHDGILATLPLSQTSTGDRTTPRRGPVLPPPVLGPSGNWRGKGG